MIKFEEHDDNLFRMLEEPVPLTSDAEMPCLIRLIQDDSPMGRYNKAYSEDKYGVKLGCGLLPIIATHIGKKGIVNDIERDINRYEIIGYPVVEGSAEWAWYQMMKGEKVTKGHLKHIYWHYDARPHLRCISEYNCGTLQIMVIPEIWVKTADKDGWQIYKEPKPLLAEAKVGDLCQRRDGKWVQIDRLVSIGGLPWICYEAGGQRYINTGTMLNYKRSNLDILSTEPLAPEGSAEWAWQMLMLRKPVSHPAEGEFQETYYTKEGFVRCMAKTGWRIYTEPKPTFKVGDWVKYDIDAYLQVTEASGAERTWCKTLSGIAVYPYTSCLSKIKPSEVIIKIGCLSGTIAKSSDPNYFLMLHSRPITDCDYSIIRFSAIDTPTRELVEGLLRAQKEEQDEKGE